MKILVANGGMSLSRLTVFRAGALALSTLLLASCSETPNGNVSLNEAGGITVSAPDFLLGRAIVQRNLTPRVRVEANGVTYQAVQTNSSTSPWRGQVYVPEGSDPVVNVTWVETEVEGLPLSYNNELPLALFSSSMENITANESLEITTDSYITQSSEASPHPELDIDSDGISNLEERLAGSRPGDAGDIPASVLILYNARAPQIDGVYDSLWNTAQFLATDLSSLAIDKPIIESDLTDPTVDTGFRWAAMHDSTYLYLMVFGEKSGNQSPQGDSGVLVYEDDSADVYIDGDNSKGNSYDGIDDSHFILALLTDSGLANNSNLADARVQVGHNSAPISPDALQYAICLCPGDQQIYEIRLDMAAFGIPVDKTFGLEVNINNDIDGIARDTKWAWANDNGTDDTWRFPVRMGNVRLEAAPN